MVLPTTSTEREAEQEVIAETPRTASKAVQK